MLTAQLKPARVSQGVVLSHVHVQLLRLRGMRPRIVIKETRGKLGEQGGYVRFSGGQTEPAEACHYLKYLAQIEFIINYGRSAVPPSNKHTHLQ